MIWFQKSRPAGISTLIAIIITASVALVVALGAVLIGIDETQIAFHKSRALEAFTATEGCLEEAFVKLNGNPAYTGEVFVIGETACTITVSGSGAARTITVRSTLVGNYTRALRANVDISGSLQVTSWEEVSD